MSLNVNVGEYGIALNLNVNYPLGSFTALQLDILRPNGTTITRTSGVTVPNVPLVTDDAGTFPAGQYAQYLFQVGDLVVPGTHAVRLTYTDATKRLISDITTFEVQP